MRGFLILAVVSLSCCAPVAAQEPDDKRSEAALLTERSAAEFRLFTEEAFRLSRRFEKDGRAADAKRLREVLDESEKADLQGQFARVIASLKGAKTAVDVYKAQEENKKLLAGLAQLTDLVRGPDAIELLRRADRDLVARGDALRKCVTDCKALVAVLGDGKADAAAVAKELGRLSDLVRKVATASPRPLVERKALVGVADALASAAKDEPDAQRVAVEKELKPLAEAVTDTERRLVLVREEQAVELVARLRDRTARLTDMTDDVAKRYTLLRATVAASPDGKPDNVARQKAQQLSDAQSEGVSEMDRMLRLLEDAPKDVPATFQTAAKRLREEAAATVKVLNAAKFTAEEEAAVKAVTDSARSLQKAATDLLKDWGWESGQRVSVPVEFVDLVARMTHILDSQTALGTDIDALAKQEHVGLTTPRLTSPGAVTLKPGEARDISFKIDWRLYPDDEVKVVVAKSPADADLDLPKELTLTDQKHPAEFILRVTAGKTPCEATVTLTPAAGKPVKLTVTVK